MSSPLHPHQGPVEESVEQDWIMLDDQQAAALFRLHVARPLLACQYERGAMRWWLAAGLLLELRQGSWLLSVVPTRRTGLTEELTP